MIISPSEHQTQYFNERRRLGLKYYRLVFMSETIMPSYTETNKYSIYFKNDTNKKIRNNILHILTQQGKGNFVKLLNPISLGSFP